MFNGAGLKDEFFSVQCLLYLLFQFQTQSVPLDTTAHTKLVSIAWGWRGSINCTNSLVQVSGDSIAGRGKRLQSKHLYFPSNKLVDVGNTENPLRCKVDLMHSDKSHCRWRRQRQFTRVGSRTEVLCRTYSLYKTVAMQVKTKPFLLLPNQWVAIENIYDLPSFAAFLASKKKITKSAKQNSSNTNKQFVHQDS